MAVHATGTKTQELMAKRDEYVARGVSLARAERVVILHSDVVPAAPGWITEMANAGEGPVSATNSPGVMSRVMPRRARTCTSPTS